MLLVQIIYTNGLIFILWEAAGGFDLCLTLNSRTGKLYRCNASSRFIARVYSQSREVSLSCGSFQDVRRIISPCTRCRSPSKSVNARECALWSLLKRFELECSRWRSGSKVSGQKKGGLNFLDDLNLPWSVFSNKWCDVPRLTFFLISGCRSAQMLFMIQDRRASGWLDPKIIIPCV